MDFRFDPEQQEWRREVRAFLDEHMTEALRAEMAVHHWDLPDGEVARFRRAFAERGWFGLTWPKEHGGLGLSAVHLHILVTEFEYAGAPAPELTVTSVAPMIIRHGTERNKEEFLPPIARGELRCAVGYSEPEAGTDLASLRTRAVLDGDEWVINGQKIWNSMAQRSTHEWLCVRTDPDAPKHKGISVIMVPIDSPGVEIRPIWAWSGYRTNEAFFTDVRVPATNLIGEVNQGWRYITGALDLERGALTNVGDLRRAVDQLVVAASQVGPDGTRPIERAWVRREIAVLDADVEVARLMGLQAAGMLDAGVIPSVEVSVEKVFSSELRQRIADVGTRVFGMQSLVRTGAPGAVADGLFEQLYRAAPLLRFGAGTNEVLRDVIAQRGHGLPRVGR